MKSYQRSVARTLQRPTSRALGAPHVFWKFGPPLLMAVLFAATSALAASGVSPKFDGRYEGALTPATKSDPQRCPAVTIDEFVVKGGYVRPPAKVADIQTIIFDGFVTEEGFVSGHFRLPGGERNTFEGRMVPDENGTLLSGGLTDQASGCAYLMELQKPN